MLQVENAVFSGLWGTITIICPFTRDGDEGNHCRDIHGEPKDKKKNFSFRLRRFLMEIF
jgi:hypothetical protein